ncbi:MAG: carboxypeptidase regulatory-like domain-containing protein [Bryobacteraceae bacterium]
MKNRLLTGLVCLLSAAFAQEFRATISGHVNDSSGAGVPNAKIQVVNGATNETSNATTDGSGTYSIPFLRPGVYRLTVTGEGFKQFNRENITLQVGQIAGIDVTLEVGAITESINVTAEAALLETQTASRAGVVNTKQVAELPLNARNPFMLGTMMPGVVFRGAAIWQRPFDNGAIAQWSVNGGRQSTNEFMLDGAPNNGQAGNNNIAYVPIVDAVQEFNVQMNSYDAQYGKTGGGVFNVVLKSGTNQFHATGWEFLRRKALDANTFQGNAAGGDRANHVLDQYGFQLEGPLYIPKLLTKTSRTKGFFLGSFENYRENTPNPLRTSYPELEMRNGDFSKLRNAAGQAVTIYDPINAQTDASGNPVRSPFPGNVIPASRIHPVAKAVSAFMPTPNSPTAGGFAYATNNYILPDYVNHDKFYNLILKFDFNFGDRHRGFFRHASNDRTEDRAVNGIDNKVGTDGQQPFQRINDAYVVDWVWTAGPTTVVNLRAASNRFIEKGFGRANEGFDLTSLGLAQSLISQLPGPTYFGRWDFQGYSSLGRYQSINITNNYSLQGGITKILGSHTLKLGGDLRRVHFIQQNSGNILQFANNRDWTQRLWNQAEPTTGDGYATFLLGTPSTGSSNYPLYPFNRWWYFAPYLQDDWKVSRRLTMNLGFRWDYNGPPDEKYNRMNRGFDPTQATPLAQLPGLSNLRGGFRFAGVDGQSTLASKRDMNNFQPRVGAAYQISEKLIMRGGYGLYYLNPSNAYLQFAGFTTNTPIVDSLDGGRTPIANLYTNPFPSGIATPPGASQGALTFAGRNNNFFNENFVTPKVHQFSYGFQYQTSQTSTLEVTYVGSRSVDLNNQRDFNIPSLDFRKQCNILEGGSPAFCDAQVPNPFRGVAAFEGTTYFSAANISRFNLNRPFPQFSGNLLDVGKNGSRAWYNSLQVGYNQRMGRDLIINANYTLSKTVERWGWNDPYADVQGQGLYFNDRPHFFKFTTVYDLPFGEGKKFGAGSTGVLKKLISGWEWTTFYTNASGEPNDLPGNVIQLRDPKVQDVDWKAHQVRGWSPCVLRMFNDGRVVPQGYSVNAGCGSDPSTYSWLMLPSYAPRATPARSGQIRKHHAFTMDASLNKTTQITERLRVQFRVEAFNIFNHNYFGRDNFNTDPNNPNFGTVFPSTVSNQNTFPRQIQLGIKAYW